MFVWLFNKVFGDKHTRAIKKMQGAVNQINALEPKYRAFTDEQLREETARFKKIVADGVAGITDRIELVKKEEEILDQLLPEAFAVVREAGIRTLGMRHYDVQLIGGMVLHKNAIAEMKTGEGKTLVATLALYLNALTGHGVHLVTVNEYLARRDSEWMGRIYKFLGMSVGLVVPGMRNATKREMYRCDIVYCTNNELGFDYLRDNMKFRLEDYVQADLHYAIVDEVDSILIDEARTPLIISGTAEQSVDKYYTVNAVIVEMLKLARKEHERIKSQERSLAEEIEEEVQEKGLRAIAGSLKGRKEKDISGDYYYFTIDEKGRNAVLSDAGVVWLEEKFHIENMYEPQNMELLHHINQAIRAHMLYQREVEYIVQDGKAIIVDEFTGRLQPGRRWSEGLHQAIEAKEGLTVQNESQTLASITFQNYFRMYDKLAGMTGTAETEAEEFKQIYGLEVRVIPTNRAMIREDYPDRVYRTLKEKFDAIIEEIEWCHEHGKPVLVGTISIENSEKISQMLKKKGIRHNVLNAKFHEKEAEIVAQAGRKGAVTIATNMAGRGTDIVLGGNPEFLAWEEVGKEAPLDEFQAALEKYTAACKKEREEVLNAGGLHILGTERHESRRIDNQLRGRSGRQGDPGSSRFYLSLEDDLMRIFGGERIKAIMDRIGIEEGQVIQHSMVSRAIENSQKRVEGHNFDIRKNLLEYDTVANEQRKTIYKMRREILEGRNSEDRLLDALEETVVFAIGENCGDKREEWDIEALQKSLKKYFGFELNDEELQAATTVEILQESVYAKAENFYRAKKQALSDLLKDEGVAWDKLEREIHLQVLDKAWREHLQSMDYLREGISLRSYGSRDPKHEYKKEGFAMFQELLLRINCDFITFIFHVQVQTEEEVQVMHDKYEEERQKRTVTHGRGSGGDGGGSSKNISADDRKAVTVKREGDKVGRNDPCPCGSGQKFKKCHWGKPGYEKYM